MNQKNKTLLQQLFNALLIVAVIGLLALLSVRFKTELDWTANKRNTLTEAFTSDNQPTASQSGHPAQETTPRT